MGVFLKYISKNMLEKKGRLFLLLFSIAISSALLIASMGIIDVILDSFVQPARIAAEGQNISIVSNTSDVFFGTDDINVKGVENVRGSLELTAVINQNDEITYVNVSGRDSIGDIKLDSGSFTNVNEKTCVISDRAAQERGLHVGDTLSVSISGEKTDYKVSAVAVTDGVFYNDKSKQFSIIVPYAQLNDMLGAGGKFNFVTAKATDTDAELEDVIDSFNVANDKVKAAILVDDKATGTESITAGLYFMLGLVCVVCVIIIHGAFKLIINERITTIGTFMSQGATRKKMEHILLTEAGLYGLVGSLFGIGLGEGTLFLLTRAVAPLKDYGIYPEFHFNIVHILIGTAFAVLLSVISAWMPVRSIRKMQVKDVILNRFEQTHKSGILRFTAGCLFMAAAIFGFVSDAQWTTDYSAIFFAFAFIGLILMSRKFIKIVSGRIARLFRGNTTAFLTMNNITSSKLLRGNITLLVIALSSVLLIASFGVSMKEMVVAAYKEFNADYNVMNIIPSNAEKTTTETICEKLSAVEGIDKSSITSIVGTSADIGGYSVHIDSADPAQYAEFMEFLKLKTVNKDIYEKYTNDNNRGLLMASTVANNTNKSVGDKVDVTVNGRTEQFTVLGIYNGYQYDGGRTMLIKPEDMKNCFGITEAYWIVFRLDGTVSDVEAGFKKTLADLGATYMTRDTMEEENVKSNQMIVDILSVFSYLALVITAIGIFNNIAICFQQRRKEFAVMASVGMNSGKRRRLVLSESMISVLWSVAITVPFTFMLTGLMTKLAYALEMGFDIALAWSTIPLYAAATAVIVLIASLSTMRKSSKLNVVTELKYE
ncbi:MAG: ABC transporter permease [Ruminococcus sp.]|nr:ABC transporter permease [Ruminococcus sp.]